MTNLLLRWLAGPVVVLAGFAFVGDAPSQAREGYRAYAQRIVGNPPAGARFRGDLESRLNRLASSERKRNGRGGLKASTLLRTAARAQAIDILRTGDVGHRSKRGDQFVVRFAAFGGKDRGIRGENALRSQKRSSTADGQARHMMKVWLGSSGHRRNLMAYDYRYVSTGVVQKGKRYYAVQMFWQKKPGSKGKKKPSSSNVWFE